MASIYALSLRQMSGRWRILIMVVLAAMPVLMTVIVMRSGSSPDVDAFERVVLNGMLAAAITPLVVLAIATAAFANEVEDRTLANLTLSPLPRWNIALPKLLAAITVAAPLIVVSAFLTAQVAFLGDTRATAAVTIGALVEVALYASAFVWLGLVSTQAIGLGLLYIVLWEGFFSGFVSGVRFFSIRHYSLAVMHALDERRFAGLAHLGTTAVLVTCVVVFAGFLALSVRRLRRMDVP